jgi:NitT/TauT family transport system ATP-binding protein
MTGSDAGTVPLLALTSVTKEYRARGRSVMALQDINVAIREGAFLTIVGPSGCGKSTLLNLVAGLEPVTSGEIRFRGLPVQAGDRRIGYVTQQDNLLPWRTLLQNVAFPLELTGERPAAAIDRARHWIAKVGLQGFDDAYPHELSGGMRQRANIARTLIYQPQLIMMDEPFGPLDAQTRLQLQIELLRIWAETRVSVLFITHDLTEAIALSTGVAIMSAKPGRIEAVREVTLQEPRNIARIHDDPRFRVMYDDLWDLLEVIVRDAAEASRPETGS